MRTYNAYLGPTYEDIREKKMRKVVKQAQVVVKNSQHIGKDMELLRAFLQELDEWLNR